MQSGDGRRRWPSRGCPIPLRSVTGPGVVDTYASTTATAMAAISGQTSEQHSQAEAVSVSDLESSSDFSSTSASSRIDRASTSTRAPKRWCPVSTRCQVELTRLKQKVACMEHALTRLRKGLNAPPPPPPPPAAVTTVVSPQQTMITNIWRDICFRQVRARKLAELENLELRKKLLAQVRASAIMLQQERLLSGDQEMPTPRQDVITTRE